MTKKKLNIPAYVNAGQILNTSIQGIDAMAQGFIKAQQPTSSTKQANISTVSNVTSGAATGAKIGSTFGPLGAAAGAVIGAIPGIIGHSAKVTNPLGFTEEAYI